MVEFLGEEILGCRREIDHHIAAENKIKSPIKRIAQQIAGMGSVLNLDVMIYTRNPNS